VFCRPVTLRLLNRITETIQVTKGCKYFPRGLHVGHPCPQCQTGYNEDFFFVAAVGGDDGYNFQLYAPCLSQFYMFLVTFKDML